MASGNSMRKTITAAVVLIGLAGSAAPALAATMLGANGTPLNEKIKNSHGADADGNTLTFASDPSAYLIDYSSTSILHYNGNSGGFAQVTGPGAGGGTGFADLTITPQSVTFSEFKFNMQLPASVGSFDAPNGYQTNFTFGTTVFFTNGGSQFFNVDVGTGNGENRFLISAGLDEFINQIVFSNLVGVSTKNNDPTLTNGYNFDSIRQVSFNAVSPVPEPATWALFILGFGTIGGMLRRRRQVALTA
jgi:PEP-CTERM motif-containing protein